MADDFAAAMGAGRRQGVDCALETVECVRSARHDDLERLVVLVSADFALCHAAVSFLLRWSCCRSAATTVPRRHRATVRWPAFLEHERHSLYGMIGLCTWL